MVRHYIFHGNDQHGNHFRHRVEGGFIGPLISAAAGFLLPKLFGAGMGLSEVDENGTETVITEEIPNVNKQELAKIFLDAVNSIVSEQRGTGIIGSVRRRRRGGATGLGKNGGAVGLGNGGGDGGAVGLGKSGRGKKKETSGGKHLLVSPVKKTVFHL